MVKLDRCVGSCNNINDLSNKVYLSNKTEEWNLSVFNVITRINESNILTKDILCECKFKFDERRYSPNQKWNNNKSIKQKTSYMWQRLHLLSCYL